MLSLVRSDPSDALPRAYNTGALPIKIMPSVNPPPSPAIATLFVAIITSLTCGTASRFARAKTGRLPGRRDVLLSPQRLPPYVVAKIVATGPVRVAQMKPHSSDGYTIS